MDFEQAGVGTSNQRRATARWMDKPGVLEAQRMKARERSARNRRLRKAAESRASGDTMQESTLIHNDEPYPFNNPTPENDHSFPNPHTSSDESHASSFPRRKCSKRNDTTPTPTLPALRARIQEWSIKWGPETNWGKRFNDNLQKARNNGRRDIDNFFIEYEDHVREGRTILEELRKVVLTPWKGSQEKAADQFRQVYDLLFAVLSEVRFFEVKLDDFAPAVPMSKESEIRYYTCI
ncbi:hypothetical protein BJ138DRAFT_1118932 [Hygrophoropsis aurantiaca]|uniref:Uncharacterized protein n=1 Tax=Hygrophoropsis aurantiaca TaxID=72124 RepID=A0ACB7ZUV5_9AGAM|nr:hypothetical protein BJ138DRAFT_1118932 [Hygrophoropsis aurantiaca]